MRATVLDVVGSVVERHAPQERQLVEDLAGLDYDLVVRRMRQASSGGRSDPLGFGFGDVATLLTPLVLLVVDEACRAAVADGTGRLMNRAAAVLGRLRPSARRAAGPPEVPALDRGQLATVRRRVREEAVRRGIGGTEADALADSVVARLALAGAEDPRDTGPEAPPGGSDESGASGGSGGSGGSGDSGGASGSGDSGGSGNSGGPGRDSGGPGGSGDGGRQEDGPGR
ncbi:hypothetical protein [Streptomyces roseolilacinus]|uniref:Uncharacterized protein n=1 Tax=Streptomyces roseolilacinus TaxID=66904 RepID=A0A918AW68_9ACTN|nr:hypothetical protein [Streptomyces roseolilacinus]GGP93522.1 hypothetical protein GCM10010249_09010 [Streptomyces roseolilacinus]